MTNLPGDTVSGSALRLAGVWTSAAGRGTLAAVSLEVIGSYRLVRQIGRGGLGAVYRAIDSRDGRVVALKLLDAGSRRVAARLRREFSALADLRHPNLVAVLDAGEHDGLPWLAMEFVEGLTLRAHLAPTGVGLPVVATVDAATSTAGDPPSGERVLFDLSAMEREDDSGVFVPRAQRAPPPALLAALNAPERLDRVRETLRHVCLGLGALHGRGLVHRDLKPTNVLVDTAGVAKVADFGLVKPARPTAEEETTAAGSVVGTYRYMAPEQARGGPIDERADIYALGAVLYELLAGRPPFAEASAMALLDAVLTRPPPELRSVNPGAPVRLAELAHALLAKDPEARPATVDLVLAALR